MVPHRSRVVMLIFLGVSGPILSAGIGDHAGHAGLQMVEVVAVEHPVSGIVRNEVYAQIFMRVDDHGVLERAATGAVLYLEEVAVQVHRVRHHALVLEAGPVTGLLSLGAKYGGYYGIQTRECLL